MGSFLQHLFRARGTSEVQPLQKSVPPARVAPAVMSTTHKSLCPFSAAAEEKSRLSAKQRW